MTQPLVSIVIPTRNRAQMVVRCLESLVSQSYAVCETIVIDDASTDETQAALSAFAREHPGFALTVLLNAPQRGANPSRNRGVTASRGAFVAFADDDCIADSEWIAGLVRSFVADRVGAVTGLVDEPTPKSIYDLALRGTHSVYGNVHATRLIGCNMCVRRELLAGKLDEDRAAVSGDPSVSGRGDEEDLYLKLKAEGHEIRMAPEARVLHVHFHTRRSFYRQAFKSGMSTAKLGYKYHLKPRAELLCLAAGYGFAAGSLLNPLNAVPSLLCFGAFAAGALAYNEIWRKKKTVLEALRVAPIMTVYYHLRTAGYLTQYSRLLLGIDRVDRLRLVGKAAS